MRSLQQILRDGFPEADEGTLRWLAHVATHINAPIHRDMMRDNVVRRLLSGEPLPEVAREWLAFVLAKLDDVPTMALTKGKPIDVAAQAAINNRLRNALLERCDKPLNVALDEAAHKAGLSAERAVKLYYSARFKSSRTKVERQRLELAARSAARRRRASAKARKLGR